MEWVEKTGRTVEEAKELALDQLGVTENDADVVVLAQPKTGLFGRVRGEARVRARVRPAEPRPKRQRRERERSRGGRDGRESGGRQRAARPASGAGAAGTATAPQGPDGSPRAAGQDASGEAKTSSSRRRRRRRKAAAARREEQPAAGGNGQAPDREGRPAQRRTQASKGRRDETSAEEEDTVSEGVTLQEQAEVAKEFLEGLLDQLGLEATLDVRELDDETVEIAAHGEGLGVLVGPKGATLASLQDVTRTVVQKHFPHKTDRILVDVAGYRERRAAALRRFTEEVAADVLASGAERALEPMSPADRKVVHDTVVGIEGVTSSSQGEEPRRFVVVSPGS